MDLDEILTTRNSTITTNVLKDGMKDKREMTLRDFLATMAKWGIDHDAANILLHRAVSRREADLRDFTRIVPPTEPPRRAAA